MHAALLITLIASTAVAAAASAQPANTPTNLGVMNLGYTYFNRPGADTKVHDAAVMACAAEAAKTSSYDEQSPVINGFGNPSPVSGLLGSAYHHGAVGANLENCMVARGWRVVAVPEVEGKDLAMLPQAELEARLAPWIGAATPHGQIVRTWRNDVGLAGTVRFAFRPAHTNNGQLSLLAATGHDLTQFTLQSDRLARVTGAGYDQTLKTLDKRWLGAALKPGTLASASPDGGVILAAVRGGSIYGASFIWVSREGSNPDEIASDIDHKLAYAPIGTIPSVFANSGPTIVAMAVPPGRWRISAIGSITHGLLNLCLGSPSFEVKAGELIYLGSFDFAGGFGPDMDMAPVQAWLDGKPQAGDVRPAAYTNGSVGICGGVGIYAFEIPGAPSASSYAGGAAVVNDQMETPAH